MDFTPVAPPPVRGLNPIEAPIGLSSGPLGSVRFVPIRGSRTVVIAVAVPVGARDEKKGEVGVAHFLEHVLFKQTASHPSATALWSAIEALGGEANAATDRELTTYYVAVPRPNLMEAAAILGEILFASTFSSDDIERERGVVIEEIRGDLDDPDELASLHLDEAIFGPGHIYSRSITGTPEEIRALPEKTIRAFFARHYNPAYMSMAVTGDLNPGEVSRAVAALTKPLKVPGSKPAMRAPRMLKKHPSMPPKAKGDELVAKVNELAQARLAIGVPAFGRHHPDRMALHVLDAVLGGGSGSRLFLRLREDAGLAYSVATDSYEYSEAGSFSIAAGVDPERVVEAAAAVVEELRRITTEPVSDEELARAKGFLLGSLDRFADNLEQVADWRAAEPLLNTNTDRLEEEMAKVRAVDASDVTEMAERLFRPGQLRFSLVAPKVAVTEFKAALRKGKKLAL
jgi:predicted Zn-dependent peptidase